MGSEPPTGEGPVGVDELGDAAVVLQNVCDEAAGFFGHCPEEGSVEIAVEVGVGNGGVDFAEFEPLPGEVFDETADVW